MKKLLLTYFSVLILIIHFGSHLNAQTFHLEFPVDDYTDDAWLDLRYLNENAAGDNGFIQLSADGKGFINGSGDPVRFWAVNGASAANGMSDEELAAYARSMAKMGVNLIRFHGNIASPSVVSDIGDVNQKEIDLIWRTVAAFKKEGIYSAISPFWAGMVNYMPESWKMGEYTGDVSPWGVMYFSDRLKEAYKQWVEVLYTTENPYTGIALKDDPAVALIQIKNEDGLLFYTVDKMRPEIKEHIRAVYFQWLENKYGSFDDALEAWDGVSIEGDDKEAGHAGLYVIWEATQLRTGGKAARITDQVQFYSEQQRDLYTELRDHYRAIGCQQLINANNWKPAGEGLMVDAERWSNASVDVMATNRYYSPGHSGENSGYRIDPGHTYVGASALHNPHLLPINVKQVADKPFFITESGWNSPHKYQAEGPFLISAYMSLTGVDGFFWFNHTGPGVDPDPYRQWDKIADDRFAMQRWSMSIPGQVSMYPANALLFRKGYISKGETVVHEERTLASIFSREVPLIAEAGSFDPNRDYWSQEEYDVQPEVPPLAFLAGPVEAVYDGDPSNSFVAANLDELINMDEQTVTSTTEELVWDYENGICTMNSPKAQGVAGFLKDQEVFELADITITSQNEYAVVNVVSMDDQPIKDSEQVLIQIGTVYQPSRWRETPTTVIQNDKEVDGFLIEDVGIMPWRAPNIRMKINFKDTQVRSAHALDNNGYLKNEVTVQPLDDGSFNVYVPKNAMYLVLNTSEPTVLGTHKEELESLRIYPNPSNGKFILDIPTHLEANNLVRIMDPVGRLVYQKENLLQGQTKIDMPKLPNGIYPIIFTNKLTKKDTAYKLIISN